LNWARKFKKRPLYLVEGYGDVITAQLNDIPNVAAICGTSLTLEQLLLVQSIGFQSVNLTFDFDEAGKKATDRAVEYIVKDVRQLVIKIVNPELIEKNDPDTYIRAHGAEEFLELPRETTFSWMLRRKMEGDFDKQALANTMVLIIASEPNAISREIQIRELSIATGVSGHSIEVEVNKKTDKSLQERRTKQNAIIKKLSIDIDADPASAISNTNIAMEVLERISQESDMDTVTNHAFLSLIDLQYAEEKEREENGAAIGFELPFMREFQKDLSGGDDWSDQNLWLLGGLENTGKSSFLSYFGTNIVSNPDNDAMWICFTIDDTAKQILPKIITSLDVVANGGYNRMDPLTIGNVRNPKTIQTPELAQRRTEAYDILRDLAGDERIILKDNKDGNTLSYLENLVRYYRRRHPNRKMYITVDNTHNLGDFGHMDDRSERYKRIANVEKNIVNKYDAMMVATVEYRKTLQREHPDVSKMMPNNDDIAETRALKYLANFIGHLYNDVHSRPNIHDTYHIDPVSGAKLPRIMMNVGKTKFNSFKGVSSFDFFPASSTFVGVKNATVKLERERVVAKRDGDQEDEKDDKW